MLRVRERLSKNPFFGLLDANGDFLITGADLASAFSKLDLDKNGLVSRAEFKAKTDGIFMKYCKQTEKRTKMILESSDIFFSVMDEDNDGNLTMSEYKTIYRIMDKDGDKEVSEAEVKSFIRDHRYSICKSRHFTKAKPEIIK